LGQRRSSIAWPNPRRYATVMFIKGLERPEVLVQINSMGMPFGGLKLNGEHYLITPG
jgi:hypothetical protein